MPINNFTDGELITAPRLNEMVGQLNTRYYTIDQTAGRVVKVWDYLNNREQLIYGDTGWRALDISDTSGTVRSPSKPGVLHIRRQGNMVTLRMADMGLSAGSTQGNLVSSGTIPVAFRGVTDGSVFTLRDSAMGFATYHTLSAAGSYIRWLSFWNGTSQGQTRPTGGSMGGEVSWITDTTWPTDLPGVAA